MVMSQPFSTTSPIMANYSYIDVASGTGYIVYYGFSTKDSSATKYHLKNAPVHTYDIETTAINLTSSYVKKIDIDFDISPFNKPQTINGIGLFNLSFAHVFATTSTFNTYVIVKVVKWDGSSETLLASVQSETFTNTPGSAPLTWGKSITLKTDIPKTNFNTGETLRITAEIWAKVGTPDATKTILAHSPYDIDGSIIIPSAITGVEYTKFLTNIPYKLDL